MTLKIYFMNFLIYNLIYLLKPKHGKLFLCLGSEVVHNEKQVYFIFRSFNYWLTIGVSVARSTIPTFADSVNEPTTYSR